MFDTSGLCLSVPPMSVPCPCRRTCHDHCRPQEGAGSSAGAGAILHQQFGTFVSNRSENISCTYIAKV